MATAGPGQAKRCAPLLFGKVHILYAYSNGGRNDDGDDVSGRGETVTRTARAAWATERGGANEGRTDGRGRNV